MEINEEDRRYLFERIAEVTDERTAQTMSAMFDDAGEEDPGIIARFDQQDAALWDLSGRVDRLEKSVAEIAEAVGSLSKTVGDLSDTVLKLDEQFEQRIDARLDARFAGFRGEMEALLHREIGAAIASQTRTVLLGILGVSAALFAMLLGMNQFL